MQKLISNEFMKARRLFLDMSENDEICRTIEKVVNLSVSTLNAHHKILLCGNGGSAADAQHWAAELVSRFNFDRPGLAAIALTTDTSILTAIGNDYGYEKLFARQLEALGQAGDILFAISTSGRSQNIIEAVKVAKSKSIKTVGFTGANGRELGTLVDDCIWVPSTSTPDIQLGHELIGHTICMLIEDIMFGQKPEPADRPILSGDI